MSCPNKNLIDYQRLVDSLGEKGAFHVFIKNGNKVPYIQNREQNRFIWDVENKFGLVDWPSTNIKGLNQKQYKGFDRFTTEKLINQIREQYVGDYTIKRVSPYGKGEFGLKIEGTPVSKEELDSFYPTLEHSEALHKYLYYKEFQIREEEANEDILPLDTYDQKIMDLSSGNSDLRISKRGVEKTLLKMQATLMSNMPRIKEVIYDSTLEVAGRLEAGGEIIKVNPEYMTTDTLGHEFGHLLIDLRGGLRDPFILQAIEQLENTELAQGVRERYPELKGTEKLQKEILAQAIGKEVVDLFQEQEENNKFERWLLRLFRWLKSRLGIEKNNARELAGMLIGEVSLDESKFLFSPSDYPQEQKLAEDGDIVDEELEDRKDALENLQTAAKIKNKYQQIRDKAIDLINTRIRRETSAGRAGSLQSLKEVLEKLQNEGIDDKIAIASFVDNAVTAINSIYKDYKIRKEEYDNGDPDAITIKMLNRWTNILSAYDTLDTVSYSIMEDEFNVEGISKEDLNNMRRDVDDAIKKKNLVKELYKTLGGDLMSKTLARYTTKILAEKRNQFKREWLSKNKNDYSKTKDRNKALQEATDAYMKDKISDLTEETTIKLRAEMQKASTGDINMLAAWFDTVLDTDDMVVGAMVKKFVIADRKARQRAIDFRNRMLPILKELEQFTGYTTNTAPEKMYDFMLEKNEKGEYTGHVLSQFSSGLINEFDRIKREYQDLPEKERRIEVYKWKQENMPTNEAKKTKAFQEFLGELKDSKIINEEDIKRINSNLELPFERQKNPESFLSFEAANEITTWFRSNSFKFREPTSKWENKEWRQLERILEDKNDPRTKFYELIAEAKNEADSQLPFNKRQHDRLPFVIKSTRERMLSGQTLKNIVQDKIKDLTQVREDDTERGSVLTDENDKPIDFVPIHYIRSSDYNVNDQSFDLATVYYKYFKMATNYGEKSDLIAEAEYTKKIISEREMPVYDSKGNPIKAYLGNLSQKDLTKSGKNSQLLVQYEQFLKSLLYGQTKIDHGEWDVLGYKIDKAKVGDNLNKFTAYNMLGFNMLQAVSNVTLGETTQILEAKAGSKFNMQDLHDATVEYYAKMPEIVGDIGLRAPESKIGLLNEKFDILNEYEGGVYRKNTRWSNLMNSSALFFMSHAGEHFMQTRVMMAMLKKKRAFDKEGNDIGSIYDMYSTENNKLVLDERVDIVKSGWDEENQILFGEEVKALLMTLHGNYSDLGVVAAQRHVLGRMGLMFRKFIVPGFKRRWGGRRFNNFLNDYTEGYYSTTGRYFKNLITESKSLSFSAMSESWKDLLPEEQANIRRTISEFSFMIIFSILSTAFLTLKGEADDDDERRFYSALSYLTHRASSEYGFWWNPSAAMEVLRSPAASISTLENVIKMATQMFHPFERYERGNWGGELKLTKNAIQLMPAIKQIYRIRDVEDLAELVNI